MLRAVICMILPLSGCYALAAGSDVLTRPAVVDRIEIVATDSRPVRVTVVAYGYLPDSCTRIAEVEQTRDGPLLRIAIETARPADMMCAAMIRNFERTIPLDIADVPPGRYTVDVNGVQEQFRLP